MILVDTSVWVDHLRSGNATLAHELEAGRVLAHPFVIGELACGNVQNRREVLDLLGRLPSVPMATHAEALGFLDRRALMGRGIGFIDVHLLASAALAAPTRLWTRDRRLAAVASALKLAYE
ncbi:MAG TPA: type II toxin-antitoxin system VapC family toxin [Candidatus Limnocylindria bacterium]|nr:type II toxin-antitoxin system VapC family toxin [Candidatus Limnocylindria bacterium]